MTILGLSKGTVPVGIVGASGFTGAELMRLIAGHRSFTVKVATAATQAGTAVADLYPSLAAAYPDLVFSEFNPDDFDGLSIVFTGLPHAASQQVVSELAGRVEHVVDLSADFRLNDPAVYEEWYQTPHTQQDLLDAFAYGLPELYRSEIEAKPHVAVPGCYPTAAVLALAGLTRQGLVETSGLIVNAASGVSGAGRAAKPHTTFNAIDENFSAYGLNGHRHAPEMEQVLGADVLFVPHLVPMNRGILATCYATPTGSTSTEELLEAVTSFYADEDFVVVSERSPSTKATLGSNVAQLTVRYDERSNKVIALAAIDNLGKGASGAALVPIAGLQIGTLAAGLRYQQRADLMVAFVPEGSTAAAVFTQSLCPSAPVDWCRKVLESPEGPGATRAIVCNAGNANAFTGQAGWTSAELTASTIAAQLGVNTNQVLLASTGVIGETLPDDAIAAALPQLAANLAPARSVVLPRGAA